MPSASVARRVSYVVAPPVGPRTKLVLPALDAPRRGRTGPLVIPDTSALPEPKSPIRHVIGPRPQSPSGRGSSSSKPTPQNASQPAHRLGISAMAVDLSTHIAGNSTPEGILYSAGRDGLVIAWELRTPTKLRRRERRESPATQHIRRRGNWKAMTGWDEDQDLSDEESPSNGQSSALDLNEGVLDGMYDAAPRATTSSRNALPKSIPYEQRWQVDSDRIDDIEPVRLTSILSRFILLKRTLQHSSFRQCVQSHNDWINDITLCNFNQNGKRRSLALLRLPSDLAL